MPLAEVLGRKLYYEIHGDLDAPGATPLVLVMGMAGSCAGPRHASSGLGGKIVSEA